MMTHLIRLSCVLLLGSMAIPAIAEQVCHGLGRAYELESSDLGSIVAGDVADNNIYHQVSRGRPNAYWRFIPAGDCTYIIQDVKHNLALVAGEVFDGNVYHQQPGGRLVARWKVYRERTRTSFQSWWGGPGYVEEDNYGLVNVRHNRAIVPGQPTDGKIHFGEYRAAWKLR